MTRFVIAVIGALLLQGCVGSGVPNNNLAPPPRLVIIEPPAARPVPATPLMPRPVLASSKGPNARSVGVVAGPLMNTLTLSNDNAVRALYSFRSSCPALLRRVDGSGLTQNSDWTSVCEAAAVIPDSQAGNYFASNFEAVQVGAGTGLATGYFVPEINASRTRGAQYVTPIYRKPADEIDIDLGQFSDALKGKQVHGHLTSATNSAGVVSQRFLPYPERAEIVAGGLSGQNLEIAYAEDPIAFFFLQIQGSGILRFADGSSTVIGYADQNGHEYISIGSAMKAQNLFSDGAYSMQNIVNYLHTHPDQAQKWMNIDKSYVFFRELPDKNVEGALGVTLLGQASVAADPAFVPLGAPIYLSTDNATANGLWVAQDTGGAIKGANRVDTYWGAGAEAQRIAGGMSAHGTMFVLLPREAVARLSLH